MPEDYEIIGFDPISGSVIQWDAENKTAYVCGETPEEFGLNNILLHEFAAMVRDGYE